MKKKMIQKPTFPISHYLKMMINIMEEYNLVDFYNSYALYCRQLKCKPEELKLFFEYLKKIECPIEQRNSRVVVYFAKNPAIVAEFLKSIGCKASKDIQIELRPLYASYRLYCDRNKQDAGSFTFFRKKLQHIGFKTEKIENEWSVYMSVE